MVVHAALLNGQSHIFLPANNDPELITSALEPTDLSLNLKSQPCPTPAAQVEESLRREDLALTTDMFGGLGSLTTAFVTFTTAVIRAVFGSVG
jgi:hypothetical protein